MAGRLTVGVVAAFIALLTPAAGASIHTGYAVYSIRPDGTDRRLIAALDPSLWYVVRSPEGRNIAFARDAAGNRTLYVSDLTGGNVVRLSPSEGFWTGFSFSPDGSKVAFSSVVSCGWRCGDYALYVVNADGTGFRQVASSGAGPSWSPDGTRILYWDHGRVKIVRLNDGRISDLGVGWTPAWAPRGNRIAYIGYRGGYGPPCFVDADGRNRRCGRRYSATGHFVWSPDGRRVAFQYSPGFRLGVVKADATGLRRFRTPGIPTPLAWSPDSRRLAYTHSFEQQIFVRPLTGPGRPVRVTRGRPFAPADVRWRAGRLSFVARAGA